ncbi:uncharacterized protein [Physcomitrium patens]|uniref:uncharacterized protein isoform X5 n=1 Tax=Physcomitrium patens TaxID=3218 RepID=UPI003CCCC416
MTRPIVRRLSTPCDHATRQRHGRKRKVQPLEAWKMDCEEEKSDDMYLRGLNFHTIEQIADGVERMMFSWKLDTFARGQEHARIFNASTAAISDTLCQHTCRKGENEEYGSNVKQDPGRICTVCHTFATQQVTSKLMGFSCPRYPAAHEAHQRYEKFRSRSPSLVQGFAGEPKFDCGQNSYSLQVLPQRNDWITSSSTANVSMTASRVFEFPGYPRVTIRQDRVRRGCTVLEIREDCANSTQISTCEKSVGTEAESLERRQDHMIAKTQLSSQLSFKGMASSPDNETVPLTPLPESNCYSVNEESYACQFPSPGAECQPHNLRLKEEVHACHASTPTYPACLSFSVGGPSPHNVTGKDEAACACHPPTQSRRCSGYSVTEQQLNDSPRKGDDRYAHNSSSLAQRCSNVPSPNVPCSVEHSETEGLNEPACDAVAGVIACTDSGNRNCKNVVVKCCGRIPHFCSTYFCARQNSRHRAGTIQKLEVGGRPVTLPVLQNGTMALKNKFDSLIYTTVNSPAIFQGKEITRLGSHQISSVEELQLALVECATEFEIKTLDAQMKMHELRAQKRPGSGEPDQLTDLQENRSQDEVRKHVKRQQDVKENLQKPDNPSWKKKERCDPVSQMLFDRQRKSLDDALSHVDRLQKEATKKDRELVEWQLKEKETKAELMRLEDKLKRSRISSKLEPRKLLLEIPALRETLRSLKAEELRKISSPPLAETPQEISGVKSTREMSGRDFSLNIRPQCVEQCTSEMDELKATMFKLASNMAELSLAFKDHVQFVNQRLVAIHSFISKKNPRANSRTSSMTVSPRVLQQNGICQLNQAGLEDLRAEREVTRSPRTPLPSWQRY